MKTNKIILFWAVSRSGHHAIIDWIYSQYNPNKIFLNYIKFTENTAEQRTQYYYNDKKYYRTLNQNWEKFGVLHEKLKEFTPENASVEDALNTADKNIVMLNFENQSLANNTDIFNAIQKEFNGTELQNIIVVRDIFNYLASKMKMGRYFFPKENFSVWKNHVKESLEITHTIPNAVYISYNKWCVDQHYRASIAKKIEVDAYRPEWDIVSSFGGGSSFDSLRYQNKASQMTTDKRWTEFKDDEQYISFLKNDPELILLSEKMFGHIDGTNYIINKITSV